MNEFTPLAVNIKEAAELLGISRQTMSKLIYSGEIPFVRVGNSVRIGIRNLEEYANRKTI